MIVSADGMATSTARCSRRAATQSLMMRGDSSGRTASWKSTLVVSEGCSARASRASWVVAFREVPPVSTRVTFRQPARFTQADASSRKPGIISRTISSISGAVSKTARVCSSIVLPLIFRSCLGVLSPILCPLPPARMTATVRCSARCATTTRLSFASAGAIRPPG
jgi:hypothetical protein